MLAMAILPDSLDITCTVRDISGVSNSLSMNVKQIQLRVGQHAEVVTYDTGDVSPRSSHGVVLLSFLKDAQHPAAAG